MLKSALAFFKTGGWLFALLSIAIILNHRQGYITLLGVFSAIVFATISVKKRIDVCALIILAYTFFYIVISSFNGFSYSVSTLFIYAVTPFFFYQYGNSIVTRFKEENYIIIAWLIIVTCYCLDIFLVTISNIIETGQVISPDRMFSFDAKGESILSATGVGLPMDIGMIGLPMFLITKNRPIRYSFLILFLLSLITTFSLLNRTGIVVAFLCFIIVIGYRSRKNISSLIVSLIVVSVLVSILIYADIINNELIAYYNERNKDLATMGTRTERWAVAIGNLFTHPLGWADNGQVYYVHNMWLDVARISGIVPFVLLSCMAVSSFRMAFRLVRIFGNNLSYMLLGLNVCFFSSCFVEPIYGGTHLLLYFMLWGTERELCRNN